MNSLADDFQGFFSNFNHFFFDLSEIGVHPIWQNSLMISSANTASTNGDSPVKNHATD